MSEAVTVPALRFPEFEGAWEPTKLKNITRIYDGTHQTPNYVAEGVPFYSVEHVTANQFERTKFISEEVFAKENKRVELKTGDILMTRIGDIGTARLVDWDVRASFYVSLALLKANASKFESGFLSSYLGSDYLARELHRRTIHVAFPKKINLGEIGEVDCSLPSLPEQKKIAAFLGVVDAKLTALRDRVALLERYKRGLMQALFSQSLRFTKPDGTAFPDWEEKRLGEVFTRVTRKNAEDNQNVLTISAQQGLVNQRDYFNKSVSAQDVTGYYLLEKGDFAYNKSYSKGYPMGAIKRLNDYDKGVVSTLYICFSSSSEVTSQFFEQFFDFGGLNREIHKIAQEGARNHGLLNMSVVEFFKDMVVPFPHPDEQQKIADALQTMDAKIAAVAGQVAKMEDFKKGLLQQMFV